MNKPISPIDPVEPNDAPTDTAVSRKRLRWAQQILQTAEEHETPHGADGSIEKYKARFVSQRVLSERGSRL